MSVVASPSGMADLSATVATWWGRWGEVEKRLTVAPGERLTAAPGAEWCWWRLEACCGGVGSIC
jgi:hypothetical protein